MMQTYPTQLEKMQAKELQAECSPWAYLGMFKNTLQNEKVDKQLGSGHPPTLILAAKILLYGKCGQQGSTFHKTEC